MMPTILLRDRLEAALRDCGAATSSASELYAELERRYSEPHRAYHTMAHIEACLGWLDRYQEHAERPAEVQLALWFHDAIYDPTRGDNEERSAHMGAEWMQKLGVPSDVIDRVARLVICTKEHRSTAGDAALLCSIDLTILGADEDEYRKFELAVRKEYQHVSEEAYRCGRAAVLRGFLERASIYEHAPIGAALDARARTNLASALAALKER